MPDAGTTGGVRRAQFEHPSWVCIPGWIPKRSEGKIARMADSKTNLGTGGRGDDRKQTPEHFAPQYVLFAGMKQV
jgi:hypothetical protein